MVVRLIVPDDLSYTPRRFEAARRTSHRFRREAFESPLSAVVGDLAGSARHVDERQMLPEDGTAVLDRMARGGAGAPLRSLSVVVPCYNESEVINLFYQNLRSALRSIEDVRSEIIFVDDGSGDDTLEQLNRLAASDPAVRVCSLSRNFGHQIALTAGLDFAAGDAVIMMDSDLQHPPSLIPELVRRWREGYDVVSAIRQRTEGETWFKSLTSRGFYWLLNFLSSTKIPQGAADFCLISRRIVKSLRDMPERHRFLRGLISWAGYPRTFVPYEAPRRAAGRTKYSVLKMVALALDAVFSFSAEPLRLALRAGLTITVLGFVYLAWTLIKGYLLKALVPGYSSLIGVTLILGGAQLMFIGLIGQYLARVFEEVKGRPIYLLKQEPGEALFPAETLAEEPGRSRNRV